MGATTFSGPLKAGTVRDAPGANVGYAVMCQTATITFDADLVQEAIFYLPAGCAILDVWGSATTVYDSATSATLSFGTASGGTQYGGSLDAKTATTLRPTMSAAIQGAMDDIGTNTAVYATITSVGQPTAGVVNVYITYIQN